MLLELLRQLLLLLFTVGQIGALAFQLLLFKLEQFSFDTQYLLLWD